LAAHRRWDGRSARNVLVGAAEELSVAEPDHAVGVRRGLVVCSRVDRLCLSRMYLRWPEFKPQAKYVVYFSIDPDWWDSIDMG